MRGSGSSDGGGLSDFIDGLGPGQLVGRQLLGAPTLGDVQLSMCYQKGFLEVKTSPSWILLITSKLENTRATLFFDYRTDNCT